MLSVLHFRSQLLKQTRQFFYQRGFIEVETPSLVRSPGLEVHLRAVRAADCWLHTSPEYPMKRLLARGAQRIFQITHCFREDEKGPHHAREFTMLEWYRAGVGYEALMDDVEALVVALAANKSDFSPPFARLTVAEAFDRFVGASPFLLPEDDFFLALVDKLEPALARQRPTILYEWPSRYAALARLKPSDPRVALRFELYAGGVELANAFDELTDVTEQRRRFEQEQAERKAKGFDVYPIDEIFLADLKHMPQAAGIALGFDRLVMLLAGKTDIREVMAFADDV